MERALPRGVGVLVAKQNARRVAPCYTSCILFKARDCRQRHARLHQSCDQDEFCLIYEHVCRLPVSSTPFLACAPLAGERGGN